MRIESVKSLAITAAPLNTSVQEKSNIAAGNAFAETPRQSDEI